jgi:hypothetical protein
MLLHDLVGELAADEPDTAVEIGSGRIGAETEKRRDGGE